MAAMKKASRITLRSDAFMRKYERIGETGRRLARWPDSVSRKRWLSFSSSVSLLKGLYWEVEEPEKTENKQVEKSKIRFLVLKASR